MAFLQHYHFQYFGTLGPAGGPIETWSINLRGIPTAGGPNAPAPITQATVDDLHAAMSSFITNPDALFVAAVGFLGVKGYSIGVNGRATDVPILSVGDPVRGAISSNNHPWQCSLAVSLDAAPQMGRGNHGRVYLPPQGLPVQTDDQVNTGYMAGIQTAIMTWLNATQQALDPQSRLVIASQGPPASLKSVVSVRIGRVVDTQRRRRRSTVENYLVQALTPLP